MGRRFAEDEVLLDYDQSPSPPSLFVFFSLTREATSVSWEAHVLPAKLCRVVCVCVLLHAHSGECVGVSASARRRVDAYLLVGCNPNHITHHLISCLFFVASCL